METIGWLLFIIPLFFLIVGLISSFARWLTKGWSFERWLDSRSFFYFWWFVLMVIGIVILISAGVQLFVAYMVAAIFFGLPTREEADRLGW